MKITLQTPYKENWKFGYLVINPENRRTVILFNNKKHRSSVSYARYLMAVHLSRYLTKEEQVDHIDNNKTNDDINNLQILTRKENNLKSAKGITWIDMICPKCNKNFKKELRHYRHNHHCCSRSCGSKKLS
jgi:hypothetical protein